MEGQCSTCGVRLESQWKFCPHCGAASATEIQQKTELLQKTEVQLKTEPEKPEKSPAPGAFTGLFFGLIALPILVIVGTMLCLTGLGAILGIPMIIAAVFAPLMGPMIGMGALKGKCPWCGVSVSSVANKSDFDCHACGRRISIHHREFTAAA